MTDYGITVENILRTLPEALKNDEKMQVLASSIATLLASRVAEIEALKIYTKIDALPEDLLDLLAYDFKVDWWDSEYSLDEKRQVLKDSWNVHRILGTKAAVERAISAIYPNTKVDEWFEYDGEPYHFKLLIDATYDSVDPVKHQRVLNRVDYYKNLRSHLDGIEYAAVPSGYCRTFGAIAAAGIAIQITKEVSVYGMG